MKNKSDTKLLAIKTNNEIVALLKKNKKINLPFATIWMNKINDKSLIQYALLVNKSQFKLAVERNKVKRQLRNILITSEIKGGLQILIKPNSIYLKKSFVELNESIIKTINKYNGK